MQALADIEPLKSLQAQSYFNATPERIEEVEAAILAHPEAKLAKDYHVEHHYAPGVYMRQIFMPAGDLILGMEHRTEHLNCIQAGKAAVLMNGEFHMIEAPMIFKSGAGVRKVLYTLSDMIWSTVHVTQTTDLKELEAELVVKSDSFKAHEEMKMLQDMVAKGEIQ